MVHFNNYDKSTDMHYKFCSVQKQKPLTGYNINSY